MQVNQVNVSVIVTMKVLIHRNANETNCASLLHDMLHVSCLDRHTICTSSYSLFLDWATTSTHNCEITTQCAAHRSERIWNPIFWNWIFRDKQLLPPDQYSFCIRQTSIDSSPKLFATTMNDYSGTLSHE